MPKNKTLETLFTLVHTMKQNVQAHIEELDLTLSPMHIRVLKVIIHHPHCSAADITKYLNRDKAQVTRLLNHLIKNAIILKTVDPMDKRSYQLKLTEHGQTIIDKVHHVDVKLAQQIEAVLSEDEIATFELTMEKMINQLKQ